MLINAYRRWTLGGLLCLSLCGCAQPKQTIAVGDLGLLQEIECLALAPLETAASQAVSLNALLYNELLASRRYRLMDSNETTRAFATLKLNPPKTGDATPSAAAVQIGQALKVQGLLVGKLLHADYDFDGERGETRPRVALLWQLYHTSTGNLIWSTQVERVADGLSGRNRQPLSHIALLAARQAVEGLLSQTPAGRVQNSLLECGSWQPAADDAE